MTDVEHASVEALLRLAIEPCEHYSESRIHGALVADPVGFARCLERFYEGWSEDASVVDLPKKQVFTTAGLRGDWRVMPCILRVDGQLVKAVKVIGTNEEERVVTDKISVGKALLLHPTDNFVTAIFDVGALSSFRTAAVATLAYKKLAAAHQRIGLIGCGRVGFYTALFLNRWLGVDSIMAADSRSEQVERFETLAKLAIPGLRVRIADDDALCRSSHALFLCTDSPTAVCNAANTSDAAFVSSVGADADNLSEIDATLVRGRQIVVDSMQSTMLGDLKRWIRDELIAEADVVELRTLLRAGPPPDQPVLFISTGIAIQDGVACHWLHERLRSG